MKMNKSNMYIKVCSKWVITSPIDIIKSKKLDLGSKNHRHNFNNLDPKILEKIIKAISVEVGYQKCKLVVEHYD